MHVSFDGEWLYRADRTCAVFLHGDAVTKASPGADEEQPT